MVLSLAREVTQGRLLVTGGGGYRAESVSRVLARAGMILADLPPPEDGLSLPPAWRDEFAAAFGRDAPRTWADREELDPSPWTEADEKHLIKQLEAKLGERFPTP
jgi:hypothetical protein